MRTTLLKYQIHLKQMGKAEWHWCDASTYKNINNNSFTLPIQHVSLIAFHYLLLPILTYYIHVNPYLIYFHYLSYFNCIYILTDTRNNILHKEYQNSLRKHKLERINKKYTFIYYIYSKLKFIYIIRIKQIISVIDSFDNSL